jgi:hypothetical protein
VHGPRVVAARADDVRRLQLDVAGRRLAVDRVAGGGWRLDAGLASPKLAEAIDALVTELTGLRAVDAFVAGDAKSLGLDPPGATIALATSRGVERLAFGDFNTVGSTVYARREGHERVLQVGVYVVELVRRIFEVRDVEGRAARSDRDSSPMVSYSPRARGRSAPVLRWASAARTKSSRPPPVHHRPRNYLPEMG